MAIRKQVVDGGRRTILRHTSGKDKGKLAGSVPNTKPPQSLETPIVPSHETLEQEEHSVAAAYERFLRNASEEETIEASDDFVLMAETPTIELAQRTSALLPTGLDQEQHRDAFLSLSRSVKRWSTTEEPTEEEWNMYLLTARARITDPTNGLSEDERADALAIWEKAKTAGKPDGKTYALATAAEARMWKAKYSLDEQAVQIASWYDADPDVVRSELNKYRAEYYERVANGDTPSIPPQYATSWKRTGGSAPKDPATMYAFYHAETTSTYEPTTRPAKYVALDLETTGLSTRDSHIIEIGLVEYDHSGKELGRWSQLVKPPKNENGKISTGEPDVVAVHNIKVKDVINQPTFDEILPELNARLSGATIIGHNLGFDTKHLRVSMKKYAGDNVELSEQPWTGEADTLFHASRHMTGLENNKLKTVSASLDIPYTNGHRAEHDAAVSGEVFFKIRQMRGWGSSK